MAEKATPTENKTNVGGDHDRVVMASRLPDGTPHQTNDFEYIGDQQVAIDAAKHQLREQAVSAKDVEMRGASTREADAEASKPDAEVQKLIDAHESAAKSAEGAAEAEVKSHSSEQTKASASQS